MFVCSCFACESGAILFILLVRAALKKITLYCRKITITKREKEREVTSLIAAVIKPTVSKALLLLLSQSQCSFPPLYVCLFLFCIKACESGAILFFLLVRAALQKITIYGRKIIITKREKEREVKSLIAAVENVVLHATPKGIHCTWTNQSSNI